MGVDAGESDAGTLPYWPTTGSTTAARPLSGGTLAVSADGTLAVASDPDRDQVWFVDLSTQHADALALTAGDEPGRIAEDGAHRAHVVLRSAGAIADIDLRTHALIARRPVCAAPRGIAYDPDDDTLRVACVDGSLLTLPAAGGAVTGTFALQDDLRDVVYDTTNHQLVVSRFRSASVLVVDPVRGIVLYVRQPDPTNSMPHEFAPDVAWRIAPLPTGGVVMVHQYAVTDPICPSGGGYTGSVPVVVPAATSLTRDTTTPLGPLGFAGASPAVDVAVAGSSGFTAIANAGAMPGTGHPSVLQVDSHMGFLGFNVPLGQVVAVAYTPIGTLLAQTRDPAMLYIDVAHAATPVMLGTALPHDTGHQIFHAATGGGLSCAGCHPEGGDDGHVWNFGPGDLRRTQNLRGGVLATAPFHWDGAFTNISSLLVDVFHGRMAGPMLTDDQSAAVQRWLNTIPLVNHAAPADTSAVARGQALFNDPTTLCVTCHSGPRFTNNVTVDVGTGAPFQVPSLTGVAYRGPYMHDGCAPTLRERFTGSTTCTGGDRHGHTSGLTSAQIDDLVAYLSTL